MCECLKIVVMIVFSKKKKSNFSRVCDNVDAGFYASKKKSAVWNECDSTTTEKYTIFYDARALSFIVAINLAVYGFFCSTFFCCSQSVVLPSKFLAVGRYRLGIDFTIRRE